MEIYRFVLGDQKKTGGPRESRLDALCCHLRQDKGGVVEKEDPFMKVLEANRNRLTGKEMCLGKIRHFSGKENRWFGVFLPWGSLRWC